MIHVKEHVRWLAALTQFAIYFQLVMQVLQTAKLLQFQKLAQGRRTIESFGFFPGQSLFFALLLYVSGCEVDSQGHLAVIASCKFRLNVLAQSVDLDDQFEFVMDVLAEIGEEKGFVVQNEAAVGLQEKDGLFGDVVAEFLRMEAVIPTDANDFHFPSLN
jgi:hypothetical protein